MADSRVRVGFDEESIAAMKEFSSKIERALQALAAVETFTEEPTEPGFYAHTGRNQNMIFLRLSGGQWHAISDNGNTYPCDWTHIEQALGVWDLVRIDALMGGF